MFYPIKLDRERNFKYNMRTLSNIEKKFGKPLIQIPGMTDGQLTMADYAVIMCEGLRHEDPDLTPDRVMDLVDEHSDLATVTEAMWKAFNGTLEGNKSPKNEEKPAEGKAKAPEKK
jgi:hypothetical protein